MKLHLNFFILLKLIDLSFLLLEHRRKSTTKPECHAVNDASNEFLSGFIDLRFIRFSTNGFNFRNRSQIRDNWDYLMSSSTLLGKSKVWIYLKIKDFKYAVYTACRKSKLKKNVIFRSALLDSSIRQSAWLPPNGHMHWWCHVDFVESVVETQSFTLSWQKVQKCMVLQTPYFGLNSLSAQSMAKVSNSISFD